ncbi:MAG TPA: hypothetical protein VEI97_21080, partial [bacterium]|nr:hypothetical protein [bacterium]
SDTRGTRVWRALAPVPTGPSDWCEAMLEPVFDHLALAGIGGKVAVLAGTQGGTELRLVRCTDSW